MHARVLTFRDANDIEAGVSFLREKVIPLLGDQNGYRGMTASADRAGGVLGVLTLWETAEDRAASFGALADVRQEADGLVGGKLETETFEEMVVETGSEPPEPGAFLMITRVSMDPAAVDENAAYFKAEVAPRIKERAGFRGLRSMMNRETGKGITGTVWSDEEALKAAAEDARASRERGAARDVNFGEVSFREILLIELP